MKLNLDEILFNFNGEPMQEDGKPLTLKNTILNALGAPDKDAKGEEKLKRYKLGMKITNGGAIDLKTEEVASIKKRVSEVYFLPIIIGEVDRIIEGQHGEHTTDDDSKS